MQSRLGYACINTELSKVGVTIGRTVQRKGFIDKGLAHVESLAISNVADMLKILEWNKSNNIEVYRMSSDMLPWVSEYSISSLPRFSELRSELEKCGCFASSNNMRLSFHPGPFNCLGSEDSSVVSKAIAELDKHAEVMDLMGLPQTHMAKINIHVGGAYGDKGRALSRFARNFYKLGENTRARLTVENDDRESLFGVADLYALYEYIGTPIVFDGHHYLVGQKNNLTYEQAYSLAYTTWSVTPTFHWSNSAKELQGDTNSRTAHSEYYTTKMPLLDLGDIDIILEAKAKEAALLDYRNKF
jgi:UV DNA damage endonuclease